MDLLADVLLRAAALALWLRHRLLILRARLHRALRRVPHFATTLLHLGFPRPPPPRPWCRGGHNRSPPSVEEAVCRFHVERPELGLRGLRLMMMRVKDVALRSRAPSASAARSRSGAST